VDSFCCVGTNVKEQFPVGARDAGLNASTLRNLSCKLRARIVARRGHASKPRIAMPEQKTAACGLACDVHDPSQE